MNLPAVLFRGVVPTTNGGETHDPLCRLWSAPLRRVLSNVPPGLRPVVRAMNQLSLTPVHSGDPDSSREAAARVAPKVGSQLNLVLQAIESWRWWGISNREIQLLLCNRAHPLWNKVPTRCRTLERMGLIELVCDADGEPVLREHRDGGRFLTWRAV